jgi:hypothetical protein
MFTKIQATCVRLEIVQICHCIDQIPCIRSSLSHLIKGQSRPKQAKAGHRRLKQATAGQSRPKQAKAGQSRLEQAKAGQSRLKQPKQAKAGQNRATH